MCEENKMKVCFLAPELYPIWGGGGTYAIALLKYLPKDVEIYVLATRRKVPEDKTASKESALSFLGDNIHVYNLADEKDTFFSHANFQRLCYNWVPKLDKEHHFDIIHSQHQPMSDILLKLMSKHFCYITTVHETFSRRNKAIKESNVGFEGFESSEKWMVSLSLFLKTIEKIYMRKSHAFISPSRWMQNMLHEDFNIPPSNVRTVYNGVDHRKFSPGSKRSDFIQKIYDDAGGPIVLFSGRMISTKGIHVLVKAMPKVIREVKDAHFVFTGGGNSRPYRQMINQMKIPSRNYNFVGYVRDFEDLPGLYSIASVFAAPTLYENFPFRVLENMSCQNAIVATKIVGIPEMITDEFNGLLVPPSNSDKLAEKIVELINDRALAKKLGQNARRTVEEQFTVQTFANKTKEAYTWAMNNN
jgi:glycosyltransferase involved in cell wall biosynthesis